jgi:hypothetical protein
MLENRMPRIFGPKKYEIIGSRRKSQNEGVHDFYS